MKKMKAYVRTDKSSQEVKMQEVPLPEIEPDEVLIKVEAFGVGIHDRYFIPVNAGFPYTIGSEGAGIIEEIGSSVREFEVGDRVIFTTSMQAQGGSWAEFAAAKTATLILMPDDLTFAQGAAIPIAGKTALECMRALALNKNDSLFIAGASGAIGTLVIQLAAQKGIRIAASASEKNHDYMKTLGAKIAVDYRDPAWQNKVLDWSDGGVDAALAIQPGTGNKSIEVVKDSGKLITVSGDSDQVEPTRNISVKQMSHHDDTRQMVTGLVEIIAEGDIQIVLEKVYPFAQALDALAKTETRHARGKVVVEKHISG